MSILLQFKKEKKKKGEKKNSSPGASKGAQSYQYLELSLLASTTVRE